MPTISNKRQDWLFIATPAALVSALQKRDQVYIDEQVARDYLLYHRMDNLEEVTFYTTRVRGVLMAEKGRVNG